MMNSRLICALMLGACVLGACAQSRPKAEGFSSETHFLQSCSGDTCGKGLSCVCGACTKACDATSACAALATNAICVAPADAACNETRSCDVECKANTDCAQLGNKYACTDGRCRALVMSPSKPDPNDAGRFTGDASDWFLSQSEVDALWACQNRSVEECASDGRCAVINAERYDDRQACFGELQPTVCYPADWGGGGSLGCLIDPDGVRWRFGMGVKLLNWKQDPAQINCGSSPNKCDGAGLDSGTVIPPSSCAANACQFDGVCYPSGTQTEDGCCTCDDQGMGSCIEPGWCPGWVLIGKRCSADADCSLQTTSSSGLHCRTDLFGERGVCTRDCNFGCPTGTECVAEVPDFNGGTIKNVCMRPCSAPADCAMESHGNALGSECDAPGGLAKSYCF